MDSTQNNQQNQTSGQKSTVGEKLQSVGDTVKAKFEHHKAAPGPVQPQEFNVPEEGTKEERRAKAEQWNK